jgi:hypothetical protein
VLFAGEEALRRALVSVKGDGKGLLVGLWWW